MRIAAFDLSLTRTGYADNYDYDGAGVTTTLWAPKGVSGVKRIGEISNAVAILAEDADLVVLEGYSYGSHQSHTRAIAELGGVVKYRLYCAGIPYISIPPSVVKKLATGKGNAAKEAVLVAAVKRLGYQGTDHNEADALWLLQAALHHYGLPGAVELPKTHLKVLEKWPWEKK